MATQSRLPTGNGVLVQLTPSAGANWECVNDPIGTPDEDTTYVHTSLDYKVDYYTFTAFAIDSSEITKVTVTSRVYNTVTDDANALRNGIYVNGNADLTGFIGITTSYADYPSDWLTNPETAAAWLEADVEGTSSDPLQEMIVGSGDVNSNEIRCTQCYITVDYEVAAGVAPTAVFYGPLVGPMGGPI